MDNIKIGIIGITGYTGLELIKILSNHPYADVVFVGANTNHGPYINDQIPNLKLSKKLKIKKNMSIMKEKNLDLIFSCLPSGGLIQIYNKIKKLNAKIIDLSGDFRLKEKYHNKWYKLRRSGKMLQDFQYTLPEINREKIKRNKNISNPGCYATSILLGLAPLGKILKKSENIIVDTKSGISGAGKSLKLEHSFSESAENLSTYNVGNHRHAPEIEQLINKEFRINVNLIMVPHLLPIKRGIMSNIYISRNTSFDQEKITNLFRKYYLNNSFIKILDDSLPRISDVQNTNNCHIGIKVLPQNKNLLISSVIDNLVKGAAGQAIQNMNLLFDFEENLGL
jgi:N-acetyl-gamma-glutamyl-phosphate reductase